MVIGAISRSREREETLENIEKHPKIQKLPIILEKFPNFDKEDCI